MELNNEFRVAVPAAKTWEVLTDVERVAPCLPGAAIEGSDGDEHKGTMTIKIGPITAKYQGTVKIEEADEAARRAVMRAQARDSRGQGTAAATITSTMEPVDGGTRVVMDVEPLHDEVWTERLVAGRSNELDNLAKLVIE